MEQQAIFQRIKTMMIIKGLAMLSSILAVVIAMNKVFSVSAYVGNPNGLGSVLGSVGVIGLLAAIASIVALVLIIIALNNWKNIANETVRNSVNLLFISAIMSAISVVFSLTGVLPTLAAIIMIVVFILDTIAYSQLKNSSSLTDAERDGCKKLFLSQMVLLAGSIISVIILINMASSIAEMNATRFGRHVADITIIGSIKSSIIWGGIISISATAIYYFLQIKGWGILANAQSNKEIANQE